MTGSLIALTVVAGAALIGLHLWWRQRLDRLESEFLRQIAGLKAAQEQKYRGLEAQREALFDSMAEGLLLLDESGRVQLANRAFGEMFGLATDIRSRPVI